MSSPSFIYSWNVSHHHESERKDMFRTNNGLERYNRTLKSLFKNTTPSLICFVETLEKESRQQVQNLDNIRKGLVIPSSRKRKRDEDPRRNEFNTPSIHYLEFVKTQKLNDDLNLV